MLPWVILFRVVRRRRTPSAPCATSSSRAGGWRCRGSEAPLTPICIGLQARASGARSFLEGGSGEVSVRAGWRGQGRGQHHAPPSSARLARAGKDGPRATGLSWLGAWAARGGQGTGSTVRLWPRAGRRPHPLWGQWRVSGSRRAAGTCGVVTAARVLSRLGRSGRACGVSRAFWAGAGAGQLTDKCSGGQRLEQNSSSVTFGQDCLFLCRWTVSFGFLAFSA